MSAACTSTSRLRTIRSRMTEPIADSPLPPVSSRDAALAYAEVEAEMDALKPHELAAINVHIPRAVVTALGARPALLALRPRIVKELPFFPIASLDKLETYALAAYYADLLSAHRTGDESAHRSLVEEAAPLRSNLLVAAEALAHRNLLDPAHVAAIRRGQGHLDLANDLVTLATLFRSAWGSVQYQTAITLAEVDRAAALGPELLIALTARAPSETVDRRRRAFTLFARAYGECRRAASYLQWWSGNANEVAPALQGPRPGSKRQAARSKS